MNSTKLARRAHKLLQKSLPDLQFGHDLLFLSPVEHILRCFALERIFIPKGDAYFWRVVMPLYRPSPALVVNYGERLLGGERVSLLDAELDRTIERLAQVVRGGELERLNEVRTPKQFLQHVKWEELPSTPNYRIDLALTHYLAGDAVACQEVLDELVARPPNPRWGKEIKLAQEMAQEARENPSALTRRIEAWEQDTRTWLHLFPRSRRRTRAASG